MGFSDLLAQNVFVRWIRGTGAPHDLALSMAGVRLGERVVVIGGDGGLVTALGGKVGYTGRACAVVADEAQASRARQHAERAGVLVEVDRADPGALPYDAATFDLVVCDAARGGPPTVGAAAVSEAVRVLRPGGRCLAILADARGGVGEAASHGSGTAADQVLDRLRTAGFRAVRVLAQRESLTFVEAIKAAA